MPLRAGISASARLPLLVVAGALLAAPPLVLHALAAPTSAPARKLASLRLRDDRGGMRSLGEFKERKALAIVFLGTDCPIANSYAPELAALAREYGARGVQVVGVNANPDEPAAAVAQHARAYSLGFPVLKDDKQALADLLGARVTPEAFVLDEAREVRYRGRIDDRYKSRTKSGSAGVHDLREALDAVLAGKPVKVAEVPAFGCAIARPEKKATTAKVTYHRDVAPILQERCQSCHRPGQVAPFSLLSYKEAKSWGSEIKAFTGNRQMPPWLAEPGHGEFQDVRRLSDGEVATLASWVDGGMPEGNPKQAAPARQWSDEWMLGKPDLVLTAPEEYEVAASGPDDFRVFVLPTGLTEGKQVVAVDFKPGNARVVHHVVSFVDTSGKGRELDAADPGPGYSSGPGGVKIPSVSIQGVWAPGNLPRFLPKGVARPLPKGADVVIQVHYHKTGKVERDKTQMALYFGKEPATQQAHTAIFGP
ncbi:MAG: resA 3, partial [Armatimonadetes bacterium]|nr:resA 3 [Armatimonadota bacterium]